MARVCEPAARAGVDRGEEIEPGNFVIVESPIALDRILEVQYFRRNLALLLC